MKAFAAGVLLSATGVWHLAVQQTPQPPARFKSAVDIVRIEASVLDHDRRPVRGLRAEDFVVVENGQERPVVAFAPVARLRRRHPRLKEPNGLARRRAMSSATTGLTRDA